MHSELRALLHRVRDGEADAADARVALAEAWGAPPDGLLPEPVDPAEVDAILAVLDGADDAWSPGLRRALSDEVPEADVADAVLATLAIAGDPLVAVAVAEEAGVPPELATALDPDALPIAEAVAWEAGDAPDVALRFVEVAWPVAVAVEREAGEAPELARAFDPAALPVGDAVRHEAGAVDVAPAVMGQLADPDGLPEAWLSALLDRALPNAQHVRAAERAGADPVLRERLAGWAEVGRLLREEVVRQAGTVPSTWSGVATAIGLSDPDHVEGWDEALLGEALRAEAGEIDVADAIVARLGRQALAAEPEIPAPANRGTWAGAAVILAIAAAALLLVGLRAFTVEAMPTFREQPVTYASAEELRIDKVRYGENQSVFVEVPPDDDEPVVIWVDDGGNL